MPVVYEVLGRIVTACAAAQGSNPQKGAVLYDARPAGVDGRANRGCDPTIRKDEVRSLETGLLAKKEELRMAVYVLVGGGWLGGWCWEPVARRLREGHNVYPATLTGLGERVHPRSSGVDLEATSPTWSISSSSRISAKWFSWGTATRASWSQARPTECPTHLPASLPGHRTDRWYRPHRYLPARS